MDKQSCRGGCPYARVAPCRVRKATRYAPCRGCRGKLLELSWYFYNLAIYAYIHQPANLSAQPLHGSARLAPRFRALSARLSLASPGHLALGARRVNFRQLDMDVEVCFASNLSGLGFWLSARGRASGVLRRGNVPACSGQVPCSRCYRGNNLGVTGNTQIVTSGNTRPCWRNGGKLVSACFT